MGKVASYPLATPLGSYYVFGTNTGNADETVNYLISDLLALLNPGGSYVGTLQQVTALGNTTTYGITVGDDSTFSANVTVGEDLTVTNALILSGTIEDSVGSEGTSGQVLYSQGAGTPIIWGDVVTPTLQQVTTEGATSSVATTFSGGLTSSGTSLFSGAANFTNEIQLSGDAGTAGYYLASAGSGSPPVWTALPVSSNIYTANGSISGLRTINGLSSGTVYFSNFNTFRVGADSFLSTTTSSHTINTGALLLQTPAVKAATATDGQFLKLTNSGQGSSEWSNLGTSVSNSNRLARWTDTGKTLSEGIIQDDGVTVAIGVAPSSSRLVNMVSTLGYGVFLAQTATTDPNYGIGVASTGAAAIYKCGIQALVYLGTTGSEQIGIIAAGGTSTIPTITTTQVGGLFVGGATGVTGQDSIAGYFHARESNAGDNIGTYIDVTNAGAGDAYLGVWKDGNEGVNKVPVSDANGNINLAVVPITDSEDFGAGNNSVSTPTTRIWIVRKTAITGSGDTVTLPDTAGLTEGQIVVVKDASGAAGTDNITVDTYGGATTIDGSSDDTISSNYGKAWYYFNGSNWDII